MANELKQAGFEEKLAKHYRELVNDISESKMGETTADCDTNRAKSNNFIVTEEGTKNFLQIQYEHKKVQYKEELKELLKLVDKFKSLPNTSYKKEDENVLDTEMESLVTLTSNIDTPSRNIDKFIDDINQTINGLFKLINPKSVAHTVSSNPLITTINKQINLIEKFFDFKDKAELCEFAKNNIFCKIENESKKELHVDIFVDSFHQGGFPYTDSTVIFKESSNLLNTKQVDFLFSQPTTSVFITPTATGYQLEQNNIYDTVKKPEDGKIVPLKKNEDYHLKSRTSITISLSSNHNDHELKVTPDKALLERVSASAKKLFPAKNAFSLIITFIKKRLFMQNNDELLDEPIIVSLKKFNDENLKCKTNNENNNSLVNLETSGNTNGKNSSNFFKLSSEKNTPSDPNHHTLQIR